MGGIDSAENSDEFASLVDMVELKSRQNARKRKVFLSVFATVIYSVFLLWEFVGSVLYTVPQLNAPPATNWNHSIAATSKRFPSPKN